MSTVLWEKCQNILFCKADLKKQESATLRKGKRCCIASAKQKDTRKNTGISPLANIPTPCALKASFQIFGWGMQPHARAYRTRCVRWSTGRDGVREHASPTRSPQETASLLFEPDSGCYAPRVGSCAERISTKSRSAVALREFAAKRQYTHACHRLAGGRCSTRGMRTQFRAPCARSGFASG